MGKAWDIREAVEEELGPRPPPGGGRSRGCHVGRNLALNGAVPSYPQYLRAADAVRRVAGVTGVRDVMDKIDLVFDMDPGKVNRLVGEALGGHAVPPGDSSVVAVATR